MLKPLITLNRRSRLHALVRLVLPVIATMSLVWLVAHAAIADLDDQPAIYVAPLTMNNYDLGSGGAVAYRSDFFGGNWDGDLVAYDISGAGTSAVKWQARDQLARVDWNTGRKIFSMNGPAGVSFAWSTATTALSATQQAMLGGEPLGRQLLEFTRGSAQLEGTSFRPRLSRLGDIVHSRPYYVRHSATVERVYVGANDGMLHAFDAATGAEVFAYIPSMLLPKLSQFAVNPYISHQYGVDGQLGVLRLASSGTAQTLLAGGLGGGARGVFTLDISDPTPASQDAAAAMAKWEVTENSSGFGNLGHVYGAPLYARLNSGQTVLLVPNGVNSSTGQASLYIINPQTGALLAEVPADASGPDNGLTSISAADLNGDGKIDVIYGGDLKGTLWKFNFSGNAWPAAATALFTPPVGTARPIMSAPAVSLAPVGGVMVNFGTGKLLETADLTATDNDYLYGILDSPRVTASSLVQATLSTVTGSGSSAIQYRLSSTGTPNYASGARGWRITLGAGERLIGGDSLVNAGRFVVTTAVPDPASSSYGGWLLQVDAMTGGGPATPFIDLNNGNSDKVQVSVAGVSTWQSPIGRFLGRGLWSQPVLAKVDQNFDLPLFNFNNNDLLSSVLTTTSTTATSGVAGGHFDFDIYFKVCDPSAADYARSCPTNRHDHMYDDIYNVVGVNMLNASDAGVNLSNALPSTTASFKLLVANAPLSPAVNLTLGSSTQPAWNLARSAGGFVASTNGGTASTFTRASIGKLMLSMPYNAFDTSRTWPGTTAPGAGLIPTDTRCVHANQGAAGTGTGPWMNGALTLQIVDAAATDASVEPNQPGNPAMGYRLKKDASSQRLQLAQYTIFWHHPSGVCYGSPSWTATPVADTTTVATSATCSNSSTGPGPGPGGAGPRGLPCPATGSADPTGNFGSAGGSLVGGGTGVQTITTYGGREAYAVLTYDATSDTYTRTIRATSDASVLRTESYAHNPANELVRANQQTGRPMMLGRLSWREVIR